MKTKILLLHFITLFGCFPLAAQTYYEVVSKKLDVMSQPNLDAKVLGQLKEHDLVEVYNTVDGWAAIKYQGAKAYVDQFCIKAIDEEDTSKNDEAPIPVQPEGTTRPVAASAVNANEVILKGGTEISVISLEEVSAKTAKVGQTVPFKVSRNIVADGYVVIPKDTPVEGNVIEVLTPKQDEKKNKLKLKEYVQKVNKGEIGKLSIKIDSIVLKNGQVVSFCNEIIEGFYNPNSLKLTKKLPAGYEVKLTVASPVSIKIK